MMRTVGVGVALALVLSWVAAAQAEPLDLKQVAADAKWVGHMDADAMRASIVVQKACQKLKEMCPMSDALAAKMHSKLAMDPRKDLHGITVYGKQIGKHEGVMIVHAKVDQKLLLEKAEKAADHKVMEYGSYKIHTWTQKGRKGTHTAAGAFYKTDRVVLASSADELKAALDVLDGKASSVGTSSPLAGSPPTGATVIFRAAGIAQTEKARKCPLAKQTESFRIAMGEKDGQSFFRARAQMTNAEAATQVKTIVEGGKALASLHAVDDAQCKKLVDALQVKAEEKTLNIRWSAPATEVWDAMQKHAKKWAEMRAKKGWGPGAWQRSPWGGKKPGDAKPCPSKPLEKKQPHQDDDI